MQNQLFYEDKLNLAFKLSKQQYYDGWSFVERQEYWRFLGYDLFFVNRVVQEIQDDFPKG
jgi:hypothetical protein